MSDYLALATVTIPNDNGIPADAFVNTWHFDGDDGNTDAAYWSAIDTLLSTFYHTIDNTIYSANIGTDAVLKIYNMRDTPPRVPDYTSTIVLTPSGTTGFPNEVAACVSYQANVSSGEIAARRRGRVFLGPLCSATGEDQTGEFRLTQATVDLLCAAAATLEDGLALTTGSMKWAVYSPTTKAGGGTYDDAFNDVTHGWVDNAYDTQRRRGAGPTIRTLWT